MAPQQPCVLIVEDEADLSQLIAEALTNDGFVPSEAATGADAMSRLKGFAYDAIIIDLKLPDATGMDILETALSLYPEIVSLVTTGNGGVSEAVQAIKTGAIDFLIKP